MKDFFDTINGKKDTLEKKESGFEDDPESAIKPCLHPNHQPPMHLVIPIGKRYRHVCPACGYTIILRSNTPQF